MGLGRWSCWDDRAGTACQPLDARARAVAAAREPMHTHIWLHAAPRTRDAATNAPNEFVPTQGPDSEFGEHLCTIRQDGRTGEWLGEDAEGNPVIVRGGPELRIFRSRLADDEERSSSKVEEITGAHPAEAAGSSVGAAHDSYAALGQRALVELQRSGHTEFPIAANRAWAAKMAAAFARKT